MRTAARTAGARGTALAIAALLALPGASAAAERVEPERVEGGDRIATAIAVAREAFPAAERVVLASADGFADALVGVPLAAHLGGPILLTPPDALPGPVADELERLGTREVVILGGVSAVSRTLEEELAETYEVRRIAGRDRYGTAAAVADAMPPSATTLLATGEDFPDSLAAGPLAAGVESPILLTLPDRLPPATREALDDRDPAEVIVAGGQAAVSGDLVAELEAEGRDLRRLGGPTRFQTALALTDAAIDAGLEPALIWIASAQAFPDALAAGPAVAATGGSLLLVNGQDPHRPREPAQWLAARAAVVERVLLVGGPASLSGETERVVRFALHVPELPGGGWRLFPDRRMVAFYGGTDSRLGVLGEGTIDEAAERLKAQAAPYARPGRPVLPAFELIATVATASAGADGMYRSVSSAETVRHYLDAARRHGAYLVLDIQPGRSDFLTEARRYEEFLSQPDVGLALDPEWRMKPHERPGQTVGQVDAAEVNAVSAYVADLIVGHDLPEKLFIVHQFQTRMLTNRDLLEDRDRVAVMIHMDGFGSREQKLDTYRHVQVTTPFWNGFKLFYDEDTNLFTPDELLAVSPPPEYVSYQ